MGGVKTTPLPSQAVCYETNIRQSLAHKIHKRPHVAYNPSRRVVDKQRQGFIGSQQQQHQQLLVKGANNEQQPSTTGRQLDDDFSIISSDGKWRVRKIQKNDPKEIQRVVSLQADGFHTGHPVPLIDGFLKTSFKAEVLSEMQKKLKYNPEDKFISLIVEANEDSMPDSSNKGSTGVLGVVEVSYIDEKEVLSSLDPGTPGVVYIASMTVSEQVRRKGAAKALLEGAIAVTKAWNEDICVLHVYQDNAPAIHLYHACGFETIFADAAWWARVAVRPRFLMKKTV
ncbi:hypothetical protein PSENEW3n2_00001949 [Picochlorum sp. SENEW3]|nr:hypothetical protein PSENEW3n2_00001949 [Picochlorum sp. SENEW3]WPT14719.1 hypothetical protein PSENEW3_00001949 [Picochlorum sp. SENEW3]